jgi:hypothetical protein
MRIQMTRKIKLRQIENDFSVRQLADKFWDKAEEVLIEKYWSGENAPAGRQAAAKLLWSQNALYVRFEANQDEPLIVSPVPNLASKTIGLWDRDVCEIFIAPDINKPRQYYEFEIAPNGEWIDLAVQQLPEKRETDFDYRSEMQSAARIEKEKIVMAIKVEWKAFGKTPEAGDIWLGNLFRCVGAGDTRGYLAWQPTLTPQPNFHVPQAFGGFEFVE